MAPAASLFIYLVCACAKEGRTESGQPPSPPPPPVPLPVVVLPEAGGARCIVSEGRWAQISGVRGEGERGFEPTPLT